jgi:hypothetical protein
VLEKIKDGKDEDLAWEDEDLAAPTQPGAAPVAASQAAHKTESKTG